MSNTEEIFQYLNGNTDDGLAINFTVDSNNSSVGASFESIIYPVEVMLDIREGHDIEIFVVLDNGEPIPVGIAKKGMNRLTIDANPKTDDIARCRTIKITYHEFSKSKVVIANCALSYYLSNEVEDHRD